MNAAGRRRATVVDLCAWLGRRRAAVLAVLVALVLLAPLGAAGAAQAGMGGSPMPVEGSSDCTWSGLGSDARWSDGGNWDGAVAPATNSALIFPASAARFVTMNDLTVGTQFGSIKIDGTGYTFSGNAILLLGGITTTYASGTQVLPLAITLSSDQTFTVGAGGTLDVSGAISGSQALTKAGAGTLTLSAANTYSGATTVSGGTVEVDGAQPGSSVMVGSAATLGGTGMTGQVTVLSGGTLAPGDSPGTITTGGLALNSGAVFAAEIDGTSAGAQYDQAVVIGTVDLAAATLSVALGSTPATGDEFRIIANDGAEPVLGSFAGLPEGGVLTVNGQPFAVSYVGGDGNDVTLTCEASPHSLAVAAGDDQSATVNTSFATALKARVLDESSKPLAGAAVTFTAPASGASGTFAGSSTVTTDAGGYATAPVFTANATQGSYSVTATTAGVATPASFHLTNLGAGVVPRIISVNTATFTEGVAGSFTVTATGIPVPDITATGALPSGVTLTDDGDGTATLGGTPAAGARGDYVLTVTAANGVTPDATQAFTLHVGAGVPPVTTVTGAPGGWVRRPVRLTFHAVAGAGGAPLGYTEYRIGSGAWKRGDSVVVDRQGVTRVSYRSVDTAGDVEKAQHCAVRIDSVPPVVTSYGHPVSWRGGNARFSFRIDDAATRAVRARLVITRYGRAVRSYPLGMRATGKRLVAGVHCGLGVGTWSWRIDVRDPAGTRGVGRWRYLEVCPR